jgi:hypothetical protein
MRSAREIAQGKTMRNGVWMISRLPLAAALLALPAYAANVNTWRYTSGSNMVNGEYAPGALGFNLADVSSLANLNRLPDGVKGLVYIGTSAGGCTGNSAQFRAFVEPYKDNPKLWGFYLMDEPYAKQVGSIPPCPMENLKAETEYVHANLPGVKTFVKLGNIGTTAHPDYMDFSLPGMLDVYGIGGYPCRTANLGNPAYPDGCDIDMLNRYVQAARDAHIPPEKMAPTYQAFGGWSNVFIIPSAEQQQAILRRWKELLPAPPMFMAYSYGQQANSTGAIATVPHLQEVFRDWNTLSHRCRD